MILDRTKKMYSDLVLENGAREQSVQVAEQVLRFAFPPDFRAFLLASNGATGEIWGQHIEIWSVEDILSGNEPMEVGLLAPGLVGFGSDGANEMYAFDSRMGLNSIVRVP